MDPLDLAWEQGQQPTPKPQQKDPLDAAWDQAQTPATSTATIEGDDPLDAAWNSAQPKPPRILPELEAVEFPAINNAGNSEAPEDPAVAAHRAKFGEAPAQVARDRATGATVTTGQPKPIGIPKSEVDRLVGSPDLATRIHARLQLLQSPEGYRYTPPAPTFAELATHVFLDQMASPFIGHVADQADEAKMEEYAAGGGSFDTWRANVLGLIASGGAVSGNVAVGRALGAGAGSGTSGSAAAASRLGIPNATPAMAAGAARAVQEIALEHQVHPSLAAKIADRARQALAARTPIARELAGQAAGQGVAGAAMGGTTAIAEGERDPLKIARAAAESGLTFAALGAAFHGMTSEQQFRVGYQAARRSLEAAEQLRTRVTNERMARTPPADESSRAVVPADRPLNVEMIDREESVRRQAADELAAAPPLSMPERTSPNTEPVDPLDVAWQAAQPAGVAPAEVTPHSSDHVPGLEPADVGQPGAPGAVGRSAGSGVGSAAEDAASGSRPAGVQPGEGAPIDATDAQSREAAPAVRDDQGRLRRNLQKVPSEAIADEVIRLGNAIGEDPAAPTLVPDDNFHTFNDGRAYVGMKAGAMKAAGRNQARTQAMQRLTAELERRGENVDDAMDAALERVSEREAMQGEDETRRPNAGEEVAPGVMFSPMPEQTVKNVERELMFIRAELGRGPRAGRRAELEQRRLQLEKYLNVDRPVSAAEMALRAKAGETSEAVESITGEKPLETSRDRRQMGMFGEQTADHSSGADDIGPDQGMLFSPAPTRHTIAVQARAHGAGISGRRAQREVKTLMEISRSLAEMAGVPLRQGRFGAARRQAVGVFIPSSEVTRTVRFDKLDTAAHEVGHYVSLKYLRNPTMRAAAKRGAPALTTGMKRELVKMGRDLYGDRKPAGGYGEEGIAQWARFYVVDQKQLQQDAPLFSAWMETNVLAKEPGLKAALDQARLDFDDYKKAPATARVDAMINTKPGVRHMPDPRRLATMLLDDLAEVRRAVDELASLGTNASPEKQAYTLARLTRGDAGVAEEMIERGIVDPATGARVTRGISEILGELKKEDIQPLRRYLAAERALEFWERGVDSGLTRADAKELVDLYRDEYKKVAEEIWGVSNALLDYRVAKKNLTAAEAKEIKANNKRRVGFYRVFGEDETASRAGFGRGFGRNSSGLQRATGSSRDIIDPLESILTDVYKTVKQAHSSDVMAALVEHAEATQGGGRVLEVLLEAPQERVAINVQKVMGQLAELGIKPEGIEDGETSSREITGMLVAFQDKVAGGPKEAKDLVRPVVINGERKWIQLKDAQLYDALAGLGTPELKLWRVLSAPTRTLRAGATLTAEFIARNPVRDAFEASIYSRAGFRPPGFELVRGLFHVLQKDDLYQRWRLEGGDNAAMLGLDRPTVRRHVKDVLRSRTSRATGWILHPIDTLRMLSSLFENATRVGEFAAVESKALKGGATPKDAAVEGAIAARDVTIDFGQAGTETRKANELVAFLNATVRGWAKLLREAKERPDVVFPRILAAITIPSLLLWWAQKDDEDYQNVPTWQKAIAWVIVERGSDGKTRHIWRIPKPAGLGVIFGTIPERIAEWIYRDDPKAFDKFGESLKSLNPVGLPNALTPMIEWWANKNFFTDRQIVPEGAQDLPAGEQSTSRTGEFARVVGDASHLSPAKLENTVRGYSGGLGQYFLEIANATTREVRDAMNLPSLPTPAKREGSKVEDLPGIRGFAVHVPQLDAQPVQDVLDTFSAAEARRQAWRKRKAAGDRAGATEYFKEHEAEIRSVASAEDGLGRPGNIRLAHELITDAQQLAIDADDATRQRVADMAIAASRGALAGEAVKRADIRTMKRELAQRKRVALRRVRGTTNPE